MKYTIVFAGIIEKRKRLFAYPKPNHAKSALTALVMTRPYVSIIGKIMETIIAKTKERDALKNNQMFELLCLHPKKKKKKERKFTDRWAASTSALLECIRSTR